MTKALFKKQMMELLSVFIRDRKKGNKRSKLSMTLYLLLYAYVCGVLIFVFYNLADMLCVPFVAINQDWLYFALMGMMAIAFGVFGSVFNTYSSMYHAKDNDLLLSMPIPPSKILLVRLLGVYIMGLFFEALIFVPTIIVYAINKSPGIVSIIFSVLLVFLISVLILVLSCILGWGVALISSRVKNKSIVTVVLSLGFIAVYYYFYAKAYEIIKYIISNTEQVASAVKNKIFPIYHMGKAAEGNVLSMLIFSVIVFVAFGIVYVVLSRSFMNITTKNTGAKKNIYKEKKYKKVSVQRALLYKEAKRFLGSPIYMLNCGLGIVIMVILSIFSIVKANFIRELISQFEIFLPDISTMIPLIICAFICVMASTNYISAPSISLEGKMLWVLQSLPVTGWQVLKAKIKFHMLITVFPALLCVACIEYVVGVDTFFSILIPIFVILYIFFMAELGLVLNLKLPNLEWTNESVPVKQGLSVVIALFGGWGIIVSLGLLYYAIRSFIGTDIYLICVTFFVASVSILLFMWLKTKGARIFENL